MLAVLLVMVAAWLILGVGDSCHQLSGSLAEPGGEYRQGLELACAGCDLRGVVLNGVVQERGARDVGVGDSMVAADPDGDPERVVDVGLPLTPVGRVQPRREPQCVLGALAAAGGEAGDLEQEFYRSLGLPEEDRSRADRLVLGLQDWLMGHIQWYADSSRAELLTISELSPAQAFFGPEA